MEEIFLLLDMFGIIGFFFSIRSWSEKNKGDGEIDVPLTVKWHNVDKSKWREIVYRSTHFKYEYHEYCDGDRCPKTALWANRADGCHRKKVMKGDLFPKSTNRFPGEKQRYPNGSWFFVGVGIETK